MNGFQREIPKSRVSLTLDLHTGGAQKKIEMPLNLLVAGDFSAGREKAPLAERKKIDIDRNNSDAVRADLAPGLKFAAENSLAADGTELPVNLAFYKMKDFEPRQAARQIPNSTHCLRRAICCATSNRTCSITARSAASSKRF